MEDSRLGKRGHKAESNTKDGSKESGSQELLEQIRDKDKAALLKDFPEEVRNYYSKHGSGIGPQLSQADASQLSKIGQGDGPHSGPPPVTPIRSGSNPKAGGTPTKAPAAGSGAQVITFAQNPSSNSGHQDHSAPQPPAPNQNAPPASAPAPAPVPAPAPAPTPAPKPPKSEPLPVPHHKFLSAKDWALVAYGLGGIADRESQEPIHPSGCLFPYRGMPHGLYRDVVIQRVKYAWAYRITKWFRLILMVMQLLIGAVLTAIGSMSLKDRIPITVLGAANTVIAGLLAFLQNSGLPERYRFDQAEFEALEDHIKELLDSGMAPEDKDSDQILAECFDLFQRAKRTVASNLPANYNSQLGQQPSPHKGPKRVIQAPSEPSSKTPSQEDAEKRG